MEQLIGQQLSSRYQIQSLLGKQSGRRTFLATDCQTQQPVVVKLVLFSPDFDWQDLKLFEREAETLRALDHPAIPKYLDSFEVEMDWGRGFALVQTYIEARSLQSWVSAGRTFSEKELQAIAQSLLKILSYLHHRNPPVIHRDLKPSNILLQSNTLYLVDFGSVQTAHTSGTMTIVGTYGYMPPEQFGGRAVPASDLYSLGATLVYLATGQHPADLTSDNLQIAFEAYTNLSPAFTHWIKQLTHSSLSKRTTSATQALHQLTRPPQPAQLSPPQPARLPSPLQHANSIYRTATAPPLSPRLNDFRVSTTPQALEIRCFQYRVAENFTLVEPINFTERTFSIEHIVLCTISFMAVLLAVVLFSTGFLIWAMILAIVGFWLGFPILSSLNFETNKEIRLQLSRSPTQETLLSLVTTPLTKERDTSIDASESTVHLVDIPVRSLSLGSDVISGTRMLFYVSTQDQPGRDRIQIAGSHQELQWLQAHISNWGGVSIN